MSTASLETDAAIEGTALVAGATPQATGRLAFSKTGLSFWGGVDPVVLPRSAHDLMLDTRWEACAQALAKFATRVGRKGE